MKSGAAHRFAEAVPFVSADTGPDFTQPLG